MGLPAGSLEDKDLTLAYQRGEDGAYQAIHDRYSKRVHGVCRRMLGNSQDAQDAAQESFLRVYQALGRFNGRYQLGPWITRIATNVCLDHIRAKSRRPKDVLPIEMLDLDAHDETEIDGPDDIVIRNSEGRRVRRVLASLPPMHRAAIVLRDFEGLSYQEVAIALGITDCQVKALIHRARQGFKRSWTSIALSAVLPARLLQRFRKVHTPKASQTSSLQHFAESFTASAAPAASSCSAAFGQCGQFVADKFAPALTAVAIGAASLVVPGQIDERPADPAGSLTAGDADGRVASGDDSIRASVHKLKVAVEDPAAKTSTDAGDPPPRSATDPPAAEPVPTAPPAAEPSPEPATSPSDPPPAEERPGSVQPSEGAPHPVGFNFSFDWDGAFSGRPCQCFGATTVRSEKTTVNEAIGIVTMEHALIGSATASGSEAFGVELAHHIRQSGYTAGFELRTAEGSYIYNVSQVSMEKSRTAWGGWSHTYTGTYSLGSRPSKAESVPERGTYTAVVDASVTEQRVVSLRVSLQELR